MSVISSKNTIAGTYGPLRNEGVPSAGTNKVQTLTIGGAPTGGAFTLRYGGVLTSPIAWSGTNATLVANIQAALDAHASVGAGGLVAAAGTLSSGIGTVTLTAGANLAKLSIPTLQIGSNALTGTSPTVAVAETTAGVTATHRGVAKGGIVIDTANGVEYINTGTPLAPVWSKVGTQS